MTHYMFCMALLMTYAYYWKRLNKTGFNEFCDYYFWWFTESDGLTLEDWRWCWDHDNKWIYPNQLNDNNHD